jgi:hypothetical protein
MRYVLLFSDARAGLAASVELSAPSLICGADQFTSHFGFGASLPSFATHVLKFCAGRPPLSSCSDGQDAEEQGHGISSGNAEGQAGQAAP